MATSIVPAPVRLFAGIVQFSPTEIETVVPDNLVEPTIKAIVTAARTGEIGDGRVFVTPVEASYKIRTGERET